MRKAVTILLAIGMTLSLFACGGRTSPDKEKLIGIWHKEELTPVETAIGTMGTKRNIEYIFFEDNTFYREIYSYDLYLVDNEWLPFSDITHTVISGKYSMEDEIITLTYKEDDEAETIEIPYYINEYSKELFFNPDRYGNSDWMKISGTPQVPQELSVGNETAITDDAKNAVEVETTAEPVFTPEPTFTPEPIIAD